MEAIITLEFVIILYNDKFRIQKLIIVFKEYQGMMAYFPMQMICPYYYSYYLIGVDIAILNFGIFKLSNILWLEMFMIRLLLGVGESNLLRIILLILGLMQAIKHMGIQDGLEQLY